MLRLSDFDYELPRELIAQHPLPIRDESRLLVLNRRTKTLVHRRFLNIIEYLNKGDLLVLNETKVIPARIIGHRKTGARVEALLCRGMPQSQSNGNNWYAMLNTNAKLKVGEQIIFENGAILGTLLDRFEPKQWIINFEPEENFLEVLNRVGKMPLPPYIKRKVHEHEVEAYCNTPLQTSENDDRDRYQTIFARREGAIAAPTASLHFTHTLLEKIKDAGVELAFVLLHVGPGTFLPIETEDIQKHVMQEEYYEISVDAAHTIKQAKDEGRRVIAVGSTTCRVLEAIAKNSVIEASSGWTNLFIYPPYKFNIVDALITNFHLPKTTLLLMVSALAGRKEILNAYETAKKEGYRFYSYGDAMLII